MLLETYNTIYHFLETNGNYVFTGSLFFCSYLIFIVFIFKVTYDIEFDIRGLRKDFEKEIEDIRYQMNQLNDHLSTTKQQYHDIMEDLLKQIEDVRTENQFMAIKTVNVIEDIERANNEYHGRISSICENVKKRRNEDINEVKAELQGQINAVNADIKIEKEKMNSVMSAMWTVFDIHWNDEKEMRDHGLVDKDEPFPEYFKNFEPIKYDE